MNPLDPNASLTMGTQYTLSMSVSGVVGVLANQSVDSITQQLEQSAAVDLATGIQTNSPLLHPSTYNVTFTYSGDGTDSAIDVFSEFANALNGFDKTWDFIAIASGAAPGTGGAGTVPPGTLPALPGASSLWAIALIVIVAVFFFSGGASLVRRVTA
jgi:hypothetical protein